MQLKGKFQEAIRKAADKRGYSIINNYSIVEEYPEIYKKCLPFTMTSKERIYALRKAVEYIVNLKLAGDFVECGVWKGGSAMVMAYTLLELGDDSRKIFLYDTFEGMSSPSKEDYRVSDHASASALMAKSKKKADDPENIWYFSPLSEVQNNLLSTGYPKDKLVFVKGKVEDTIPGSMPSQIALLRLDTDWYESTKHELTHLYPLLVNKGVLIIDDYGAWAGARKATDEFFKANKKSSILLNRVDATGRVGIKVSQNTELEKL